MIMMPYGWTLNIAAAHRSGRLFGTPQVQVNDRARPLAAEAALRSAGASHAWCVQFDPVSEALL